MEDVGAKGRVCVTGAGGYVASWLVKLLLSRDYKVHGTVRDPCDEKNGHLKKLDKAIENLQLFKADLLDKNAIALAVAGCEGVFHVASPIHSTKVANPEVEVINPAVMGTINVLEACSEGKVKRVVVVSSIAAVAMNPNWPKDRVMDEECWSDREFCKKIENWYCLSKTLAEGEALYYAKKHGLDVVTVCPYMVIGPLLQSRVNSSSLNFLSLLKGERESIETKTWEYVDVRDVADALMLVYEKPEAFGRYICASHRVNTRDMVDMLKSKYPNYNYPKEFIEVQDGRPVSSEKLRMLGWKCRTLEESMIDSVEYYREAGILSKN